VGKRGPDTVNSIADLRTQPYTVRQTANVRGHAYELRWTEARWGGELAGDDCVIDHFSHCLWIDPALSGSDLMAVIGEALAQARDEFKQLPAEPGGGGGDDDDDDWEREGEEWKGAGGGGGTATPDAPGTPSRRHNPFAWIRRLVILPLQRHTVVNVRADRTVEVTPDSTVADVLAALNQRWRLDAGAPSEDLPDDEKATSGEFNAFVWKLMAPPGWKMPDNLPDSAKIGIVSLSDFMEDRDRPPLITSGDVCRDWKYHCPVCGRGYGESYHYTNHLVRVHGWTLSPKGYANPPAPPQSSPDAKAA